MTSSEVKAKPGSDVTPLGEETSHFDDDTLKGEDSRYSLIRSRWTGKLFSYKLFPALLLFVSLIDLVIFYHFRFSFYLFLTLVHLTSTQTLRLQALSQWVKTNPVPGFDQLLPPLEY